MDLARKLDIRVALTSVLFALAHHPGTILGWCLYVSLGMFLGLVRYKSDLWGQYGSTFSVEPSQSMSYFFFNNSWSVLRMD